MGYFHLVTPHYLKDLAVIGIDGEKAFLIELLWRLCGIRKVSNIGHLILFLVGDRLGDRGFGILEEYDALQHFTPLFKQGLVKDYGFPLLPLRLLGYLLHMMVHNSSQSLSHTLGGG